MKVHELLDGPEKWTKGANAREADGSHCFTNSPLATCFCLRGAILHCYGCGMQNKRRDAIDEKIFAHLGKIQMDYDWNDAPDRTFEEVRNLALELDI